MLLQTVKNRTQARIMVEYEKMCVEDAELRRMRKVAFGAVVVSTVAVVACVISLPMVYNYVQSLQSHMLAETDFCKVRLLNFCPTDTLAIL